MRFRPAATWQYADLPGKVIMTSKRLLLGLAIAAVVAAIIVYFLLYGGDSGGSGGGTGGY